MKTIQRNTLSLRLKYTIKTKNKVSYSSIKLRISTEVKEKKKKHNNGILKERFKQRDMGFNQTNPIKA